MKLSEAKERIGGAEFTIEKEERLSNDEGTQLRLENGAIVNVYDTGTVSYQGKNTGKVEEAIEGKTHESENLSKEVFVVYGHDQGARDQLENMLRRWGLEPLILEKLPSQGQTIIEKLENYTSKVDFGVVLATPDDKGHRAGHPDEESYRVRQNVVLELGMLLSLLGRERVAILLKDQGQMERPSDIQGLIYIPFTDDLEEEAGLQLAKEMVEQGYDIDVANL